MKSRVKDFVGNTFYSVTQDCCVCTPSCLIQEIMALKDAGDAKIQNIVPAGEMLMRNDKIKEPEIQQTLSDLQNQWERICQLATAYRR